jgi:GntR family transcriptional regulator, vanillate catabolism transcriptional regulator
MTVIDLPSSHTKRAVVSLRQMIINGHLVGGTRLLEVALAESLQISRTPVREAMSRLAEEGLLDRAKGGGFVVRSFSLQDVSDAIELRGTLEGLAARLAAERGSKDLSRIKHLLDQLDTCFGAASLTVNFDRYSELNAEFHAELVKLSDSTILARELDRVTSLPFASPSAFVPNLGDTAGFERSLVIAQAQHRALTDAIEHSESARAEGIAREHARTARTNLEAALSGPDSRLPGRSLITR